MTLYLACSHSACRSLMQHSITSSFHLLHNLRWRFVPFMTPNSVCITNRTSDSLHVPLNKFPFFSVTSRTTFLFWPNFYMQNFLSRITWKADRPFCLSSCSVFPSQHHLLWLLCSLNKTNKQQIYSRLQCNTRETVNYTG